MKLSGHKTTRTVSIGLGCSHNVALSLKQVNEIEPGILQIKTMSVKRVAHTLLFIISRV